jgi:hypothetical protein
LIYYDWNPFVDKAILQDLVSDPKKLFVFQTVDQVDTSVKKITLPLPNIKPENVKATIRTNEGGRAIVFKSIQRASETRLSLISESFNLLGNKLTSVKNLIEVEAKSDDDKSYSRSIIVDFKLK